MDSTSTPGDFASEERQRAATAASPNAATARVQATDVHSQPVQHGGNEDDASIDSSILLRQHRWNLRYSDAKPSGLVTEYKQCGNKYARVAAVYTEGLESRVHTVEKELLELQYELGSKERPNEGRQVTCSILSF